MCLAYGKCLKNGKYYCLLLFTTFFIMTISFIILSNVKHLGYLVDSTINRFRCGNYLYFQRNEVRAHNFFATHRGPDQENIFGF